VTGLRLHLREAGSCRRVGDADEMVARRALNLPAGELRPGQRDLRGWEWRYLWQQTRSDALFTLCRESGEINSLAASSDANWLAVGLAHRGGLSVWDLRNRRELIRLSEGVALVRCAFSPTAPILAFAGFSLPASGETERSTLRLWNAVTRQMTAEIPLDNLCTGLAFSRDGQMLVTSAYQGHITLWRMPEGTKLASYASEQKLLGPATGFAATPDLSLAAYVSSPPGGQQIRVIDLHNGKRIWSAVAAKQFVTALAFSPDGKMLASAAGFGESDIRLWDVATGKEIGLEGHQSWVGSIVFWPDGSKLASASADQTVRIWDVASRKCLDVMRGHREEVWRLALLPDNRTLVSGGKDGEVCLWDTSVLHPRLQRITLPERIEANWRIAPDNQTILSANNHGQIVRWSGPDFQEKETVLDFGQGETNNSVGSVAFSLDGRLFAAAWTNGVVQVWDVSRRVLQSQFKLPGMRRSNRGFNNRRNRLIIWSGDDNRFHEWNLAARPNVEVQSWPALTAIDLAVIDSTTFSPDDRVFVALGIEGDVIVRDLASQGSSKPDIKFLEAAPSCAFSPDGKLFAMASRLGYARVWETAGWREAATLRGFKLGAHSVAFSPDGQRLATSAGPAEAALHLWDVTSWQNVLTLSAEGSIFLSTQFSPDGNTLGTMNGDGILNLWRAPSWDEINAAEAKEKAASKEP
jgi:WD40 repeat protein